MVWGPVVWIPSPPYERDWDSYGYPYNPKPPGAIHHDSTTHPRGNAGCGLVVGVLSGADSFKELMDAGAHMVCDRVTVPLKI